MKMLLSLFLLISTMCVATPGPNLTEAEAKIFLESIQARLTLIKGTFQEEYPEQLMAAMFISPEDRVLEIGGNIGRNSCVISSILNDSRNHVVLETDPEVAKILTTNRDLNGLLFHVENSAISHVPLIQKGWNTTPKSHIPHGYFQVNTLTYDQLKAKYGIPFNALVADCEGALYYIFRDDESLLNDVNLLIVENDYTDRFQYKTVRNQLMAHGFHLVYSKEGGWGPCVHQFYQVWKK